MVWTGLRTAALGVILAFPILGCVSAPPNDVAEGVGFQDYQTFLARQARLRGDGLSAPPTIPGPSTETAPIATASLPRPSAPEAGTDALAARAAAAIADAAPAPAPRTGPAGRVPATAISDEQDFAAVSARESIESDAARRARMAAERVEVAPEALPDRPEGSGTSIIAYALATTHGVGEPQYRRSPFTRGRADTQCRGFRGPDLAQEWFLANGGPERDRQGLDPDGDGFACDWNPEPYRAAAQVTRN